MWVYTLYTQAGYKTARNITGHEFESVFVDWVVVFTIQIGCKISAKCPTVLEVHRMLIEPSFVSAYSCSLCNLLKIFTRAATWRSHQNCLLWYSD